jgi:hypothetical protein
VIAHCHLPSNSSELELIWTQSINVQYLCWGLGGNLEQAVAGAMPSPSTSATGCFPASAAFRHQSCDIPPHAAASQNGLRPLLVTMSSTFRLRGLVFARINSNKLVYMYCDVRYLYLSAYTRCSSTLAINFNIR